MSGSTRWLWAVALSMLLPGALKAQETAGRPEILSTEEEMALALDAAPGHLREGAGVWVLEVDGFREARPSTNGFSCIVNRDHFLARKPTCYDAEGVATILPKVVRFGDLLVERVPLDEINEIIAAGFADGTFIAPRRPGVAYMLSSGIRNANPQTNEVSGFPPHVMFYAPDVTNQDIGTTHEALRDRPWTPFIAYQGPHGFMVVVTGSLEEGDMDEDEGD